MPSLLSATGSQVIVGGNGGKTYAFNNVGTAPAVVLAANAGRASCTFHNPGSVDIFVAPSLQITSGSSATLTPSTTALGGCFRVYANGGTLILTGECQGAYQAFAASGANNPLTVTESNIS